MAGLPKILLVEDTPEIIDIYSQVLKGQGYPLKIATTVDELLDVVAEFQPDLIFLDIMLPGGKSGLDALRILRNDSKYKATKCRIVLLTNLGHNEEVEKMWNKYADGYVIKAEIDPHELQEIINSFDFDKTGNTSENGNENAHGDGMPGNNTFNN